MATRSAPDRIADSMALRSVYWGLMENKGDWEMRCSNNLAGW